MRDQVTLRLGVLAPPLRLAAELSGWTLSEEIRHRLAASLGVPAPELRPGNPAGSWEALEAATAAARSRWGADAEG